MRRAGWFWAGMVVALLTACFIWAGGTTSLATSEMSAESASSEVQPPQGEDADALRQPVTWAAADAQAAPDAHLDVASFHEDEPLIDVAPSVDTLREEARSNPHALSPAFLAFAMQAARRMSLAVEDVAVAGPLMGELVDLVTAPDSAELVAATALRYARELAEVHPSLAPQVLHATGHASPRVVELAN